MPEFVLRKDQRLKFLIPVKYLKDGRSHEGIMTDLSLTGGAIAGDAPVSVGMTFTLHVYLPEEPTRLVIERVMVKWIKRSVFGVVFQTLPKRVKERFTIILALKLEALHSSSPR